MRCRSVSEWKAGSRQRGLTLVEVLVVVALIGVALAVAFVSLKPTEAPVQTSAALIEAFLKQSRAKAMASSYGYRVKPTTANTLDAEYAANCSEISWTSDPDFHLELPADVTMTSTAWSACFSSQGLSDNNVVVTLSHPELPSEQIEVLLGGGVRVLQ